MSKRLRITKSPIRRPNERLISFASSGSYMDANGNISFRKSPIQDSSSIEQGAGGSFSQYPQYPQYFIPTECLPYDCQAISSSYQRVLGQWVDLSTNQGVWPFPFAPGNTTGWNASVPTWDGFGFRQGTLPLGASPSGDFCDPNQLDLYMQIGNSSSSINLRKNPLSYNSDRFQAVIGTYGQILDTGENNSLVNSASRTVHYIQRSDNVTASSNSSIVLTSRDSNSDGIHDTLDIGITLPWEYVTREGEATPLTSTEFAAAPQNQLFDVIAPTITASFSYSSIFPDSNYLWAPFEMDMNIDPFPSNFVDRGNLFGQNPRRYYFTTGYCRIRIGSNTVTLQTPNDTLRVGGWFSSTGAVITETEETTPTNASAFNTYFWDDITPGLTQRIALGGIGYGDISYDDFVIAQERNRVNYIPPGYCS